MSSVDVCFALVPGEGSAHDVYRLLPDVQAKQYVTRALGASQHLAIGMGNNKPFNHA